MCSLSETSHDHNFTSAVVIKRDTPWLKLEVLLPVSPLTLLVGIYLWNCPCDLERGSLLAKPSRKTGNLEKDEHGQELPHIRPGWASLISRGRKKDSKGQLGTARPPERRVTEALLYAQILRWRDTTFLTVAILTIFENGFEFPSVLLTDGKSKRMREERTHNAQH